MRHRQAARAPQRVRHSHHRNRLARTCPCDTFRRPGANVAQPVEQLIRNQQVRGSIPRVGSNKINHLQRGLTPPFPPGATAQQSHQVTQTCGGCCAACSCSGSSPATGSHPWQPRTLPCTVSDVQPGCRVCPPRGEGLAETSVSSSPPSAEGPDLVTYMAAHGTGCAVLSPGLLLSGHHAQAQRATQKPRGGPYRRLISADGPVRAGVSKRRGRGHEP
jgi:hypothetical protein